MKNLLLAFLLLCFYNGFTQSACALLKGTPNHLVFTLTPSEADKMNQYNLNYYKLNLTVQNNSKSIIGNVLMHAKVASTLKEFTLQLHNAMVVDSVWFNNKSTDFTHVNNFLNIELDADSLLANEMFTANIFYHGTPPTNTDNGAGGSGFNNQASQQVTWTLSEPYSSYEWFPCKQLNSDKIDSVHIWITTDTTNKVGSNGLLQNITPLGNGKHRYEWFSNYPIAYYLISLAVSPYVEYNSYAHPLGADSILVQNYMYKTATQEDLDGIAYTPALIELFSSKFGLYPFAKEKYGHAQAPISGGMEHQTMTTIGIFNFDIVAHELGHQYFGDYVTCNGFSEIWLNEGFASFSELVAEETLMPQAAGYWLEQTIYESKNAESTVFLFDSNNVVAMFDHNTSYSKGAMVLYMLRNLIHNDSVFYLGIRNYLAAHAYGTATTSNFISIMSQTCGLNLDYFFNQWIYNPGYPILSGKWNQTGNNLLLRINQTPNMGSTVFKFPLEVFIKRTTGDTTLLVNIDSATKMLTIPIGSGSIQTIRFDPKTKLLRDVFSIANDPNFNAIQDLNGELSNLILFPNPAQDQLHIQHGESCNFSIIDIKGQTVYENQLLKDDEQINTASLIPGIYILQLKKNESITTLRFVKQ